MRGLKYAIPRDVQDSLNANATFQWIVSVFLVALGIFFVIKGINGFKNKRITGKRGRVFEGTTAQVVGTINIALGAMLALVSIAIRLATFFGPTP